MGLHLKKSVVWSSRVNLLAPSRRCVAGDLHHHSRPVARHRELALGALLLGGAVVEFAVTLGEVRGRDEAAGDGDFDDGHGGLDEQVAGPVEADFEIVAGRRAAHFLSEEAFDLAAREAGVVGDFQERQRFCEIGFHQLDDLQHLGILHAEASAQRQTLAERTRSVRCCSQTRLTRPSPKSWPIRFSIMSSEAVPPAQV